jgi:hypothetical protein
MGALLTILNDPWEQDRLVYWTTTFAPANQRVASLRCRW